ncbi:ATP-binding protein [Streptomyces sp. NBC_01232]|uniref:AAA family ATPase n=1 Tax=Streptomyces sp. NBC_01232 TaxID=2903786 RepID=UPI002E0E3E78|nr:ATP-binding protein [Streptomyces sp. NBC_01232]
MIGPSSLRFSVFQAGAAQERGNISGGVRTPEVRVHAERLSAEEIAAELRTALAAGRDVVMDHGFWTVGERQEWRRIGEQGGAAVTLVYLPATHDELWERIDERNQQTFDDPNSMYFSEDDDDTSAPAGRNGVSRCRRT